MKFDDLMELKKNNLEFNLNKWKAPSKTKDLTKQMKSKNNSVSSKIDF